MATTARRALVVDDEAEIITLVANALRQRGFHCESARNGEDALAKLASAPFDAVITDLKMPKRHGHALASELLARDDRPAIVIHTGVLEPRLAKDLLSRGVDDIMFKPAHMGLLAAKVEAILDRRWSRIRPVADSPGNPMPPAAEEQNTVQAEPEGPVSLSRLDQKLGEITRVLPVSSAALDVFSMTRDGEWEVSAIAAAIQRDAALTAGVLRIANSALYRTTGQPVACLQEAVLRIGQKRIGEMALASTALATISPEVLPWMNLQLAWERSIASGLAMELLIEYGRHHAVENGLLLSAILHSLGRSVLGTLFPRIYANMVADCLRMDVALRELERCQFPISHTEVVTHLLANWNIPRDVYFPLKFSSDEFSALMRLSEPTRTRAELVKVAIILGRLAVGKWQDWDLVELPDDSVLKRLRIGNPSDIVARTRADLVKVADFSPSGVAQTTSRVASCPRPLIYSSHAAPEHDLIAQLLRSCDFTLIEDGALQGHRDDLPNIINLLGSSTERLPSSMNCKSTIHIVNAERRMQFCRQGNLVPLPNSFSRLRKLFASVDPANQSE